MRKIRNYSLAAIAFFTILFLFFPLADIFGLSWGIIATILLLGLLGRTWGFVTRPYQIAQWNDVRSVPTGFEQILERVLRETDVSVNGVWMTEDKEGLTYDLAEIHGALPPERQLFVDEEFFELYDADEQRAAIINAAMLAAEQFWFYSASVLLLVPLAYFVGWEVMERWLFGGELAVSWLVHVVGLGLLTAIGIWIARRMVYRADRIATEQTSVEAMTGTITKNREAKEDPERVPDWVYHNLWTRPPPEKRVERLEAQER